MNVYHQRAQGLVCVGRIDQLQSPPQNNNGDVWLENQDHELVHQGHVTDFARWGDELPPVSPACEFVWKLTAGPEHHVLQVSGFLTPH
jgi:hypothetical protein